MSASCSCLHVRSYQDLQVVDVDVGDLNVLELLGLGVAEVQRGEPVGTHVTLDLGVGALGVHQFLASDGLAEGAAAHDVVNVLANGSRVGNGILTDLDEALVGEAKNGVRVILLGGIDVAGDGRESGEVEGSLHD